MSALVVCLTLGSSRLASASTGSLTFMRDGNVFVTAGDGGADAQVTSDGTIADPYTSASQSASGVVVAVRHSAAYRLAQSGHGSGGHVAHPPAFALGSHSLKAALRDGIRIKFSCPDGCTASADARIAAPAAKHLRLGRGATIVARKRSLNLSRGAAGVLVLRFTRNASVRLRRVPRVTIIVEMTLRDSGLTTATRKLSLR